MFVMAVSVVIKMISKLTLVVEDSWKHHKNHIISFLERKIHRHYELYIHGNIYPWNVNQGIGDPRIYSQLKHGDWLSLY